MGAESQQVLYEPAMSMIQSTGYASDTQVCGMQMPLKLLGAFIKPEPCGPEQPKNLLVKGTACRQGANFKQEPQEQAGALECSDRKKVTMLTCRRARAGSSSVSCHVSVCKSITR